MKSPTITLKETPNGYRITESWLFLKSNSLNKLMRYWIARFGPIEIGRVTELAQPDPYFVTVNAVAVSVFCKQPAKPEIAFIRSFTDFYEARAYATSFFPADTQPFIEWTEYDS